MESEKTKLATEPQSQSMSDLILGITFVDTQKEGESLKMGITQVDLPVLPNSREAKVTINEIIFMVSKAAADRLAAMTETERSLTINTIHTRRSLLFPTQSE